MNTVTDAMCELYGNASDRELRIVQKSKLPSIAADAVGVMSAYYAQLIGVELPSYAFLDGA